MLQKQKISRDDAWNEVLKYNSDKSDLNHYLESEAVMRKLAEKLGEDKETWGLLGLVHDIDWGITKGNPREHLTKAPSILKELGFTDDFIITVISHGYGFDCAGLLDGKRTKKEEFALASSETITGLIHAYALMRGTILGMEIQGLKKKFKDKRFAASIDRNVIKESENLKISLDEFFQLAIYAISEIAEKVDLKINKGG